MAIGSTTVDNKSCRLFEAQASESWASVSSTNVIQTRGVSYETLSKIWKIEHATDDRDLDITEHLNLCGPNAYMLLNLGNNSLMLRYKRIKSCLFNDNLFVTKEANSTRGFLFMHAFVS